MCNYNHTKIGGQGNTGLLQSNQYEITIYPEVINSVLDSECIIIYNIWKILYVLDKV